MLESVLVVYRSASLHCTACQPLVSSRSRTRAADAETRGLLLGFVGVVIFSMTLPMTRLAVGPADAPQLPPLFVTAGRAAFAEGGGRLSAADGLLLGSVASAAVGYVAGARLATRMPAERVICWVLVLSLPVTMPAMLANWPARPASLPAWAGFAYVTVFSMWLGFFAWYRGLALGGTVRVSQVQLVQPFLAMLFAVALLGERLEAATVGFMLAVIATVLVGRNMRVGAVAESADGSVDIKRAAPEGVSR